ncbi:MAG: hypothetical protein J6W21_05005, partial [Bacteroidaceae bacterium]|nr:hypothetical protein [Bacteroidaceae bacterium]
EYGIWLESSLCDSLPNLLWKVRVEDHQGHCVPMGSSQGEQHGGVHPPRLGLHGNLAQQGIRLTEGAAYSMATDRLRNGGSGMRQGAPSGADAERLRPGH